MAAAAITMGAIVPASVVVAIITAPAIIEAIVGTPAVIVAVIIGTAAVVAVIVASSDSAVIAVIAGRTRRLRPGPTHAACARSHFSRKNTRPVHHPTNHLGTPAVPWKLRAQSAFPISRKKDKEPTRGAMLGNSVLLTVLAFSPTLQRYGAAPTAAASAVGTRPCVATMGLFDAFKKGFENKDYSQSPGTYEQTNALSRRFECALPSACCLIADALCSNGYDTAATIT